MKLTDESWHEWKNLVYKIAIKRLGLFTPFGYELDDLAQIGAIGLNNGITNYKEDVECNIATFLYNCVDRELLKELQGLRRDKRKLNKETLSLDLPVSNDTESLSIQDMVQDNSIDISKDIENKLMEEFILAEMKRCLTEDRFNILYLKIFREMTTVDIASVLGKSRGKVLSIENNAKKDLVHKSNYFKEKYKNYTIDIENKLDFKYKFSAESVAIERLSIMNKFNLFNNFISDEPVQS